MARPAKKGLDYFPLDVDFWSDYKIMDLLDEYGPMGLCIYEAMLCQVYKNGYYLEIPLDKLASQIIRLIGNRWIKKKDLVLQVMQFCAEIGLFDQALLRQSVITSVGIQQRYSEVTARNKVNKTKYWLLDPCDVQAAVQDTPSDRISAAETPVSVTETPVSASEMPQRKENERKENERKENKKKETESVFHIEIPCRNGGFGVDETFYTELTHTYPDMDVMESLKHLVTYLQSNPEKQRFLNAAAGMVKWWVQGDNDHKKYRRPKGFQPAYDIAEYESTSVLDEEDPWGDCDWLFEELAEGNETEPENDSG